MLAFTACMLKLAAPAAEPSPYSQEPILPLPLSVAEDPARAQLGEWLFADAQLSHDRSRSCASCHPLEAGGMDGAPRALALSNAKLLRNTPTIFNLRFDLFFNWDGATESLPVHDEKVLLNRELMASQWRELLDRLRADSRYVAGFARAYPAGITRESVLDSLATYERTLITPNARFDRYLRGERSALTREEQQGYQLFKSYGCVACHQGINIGGNLLQKFGVFDDPNLGPLCQDGDAGRFKVTGDQQDRRIFRVPSLRNVAVTAPYFHNGCAATLEAAVNTMARVQLGRPVRPLDVQLIIQFLGTLTGEYRGHTVAGPARATPP
jgi:cytochrome c peroxidase